MPTKSSKLDYMGIDKMKAVLHTCISSITKIVNLSLHKCAFSNKWMTGIVKPIIKVKKKVTTHTNYRPVSNLPFISKVVERCTLQQLTQHCNNHTLLPHFQSAYQKHHGCETSLLKLTNDILMGHGKAAGNIHDYPGHCRPRTTAESTQPQIWSNRHNSGMVQELPNSKEI